MKVLGMYDSVFLSDRFILFSFCGFIDDASAGLLHLSKAFFDFPWGFLHNGMVVNCPRFGPCILM